MVRASLFLLVLVSTPTNIDGIWDIPNANSNIKVGLAMQENNGSITAVLGVPVAGRIAAVPLVGTIERTKKTTALVLRSKKYKVGDDCVVEFYILAVGVFDTKPMRFKTKARVVSITDCKDTPQKVESDDISGTWKYIGPLPKPASRPAQGKQISI